METVSFFFVFLSGRSLIFRKFERQPLISASKLPFLSFIFPAHYSEDAEESQSIPGKINICCRT